MDPLEWQRLADQFAESLQQEISSLEREYWPHPQEGTFRGFWPRVRELNERVRTVPAIKLEDKLALQRRLNELCQRARHDQRELQREQAAQKHELLDAVALAVESIKEADSLERAQEVRADLAAVRERIAALHPSHRRDDRQEIWNAWQAANQAAWERLNDLWQANEAFLTLLLDEAQQSLTAGDARGAKERIKAFHEAVHTRECAHRAVRALRTRAHTLWSEADDLGKKKHQAYMSNMSKRLNHWKAVRERHARTRAELVREIAELEQRAANAATDMAAALVRGQTAERRRALAEMESADRELDRQIESAESALSQA